MARHAVRNLPEVNARRLIRKMNGGSQAHMVMTDAGPYVVKWRQNAQHRRILINEFMASILLGRLGIASPDFAIVHADRSFLDDNLEIGISRAKGTERVEPGSHFGSRVPVNPDKKAIFDFIPAALLFRVENLNDFVKAYLFDLWTDNRDGRQAIFFRGSGTKFFAQMIDNGHAFGFDGAEWRLQDVTACKDRYSLTDLYLAAQSREAYASTLSMIQGITAVHLESVWRTVPLEWIEGDDHKMVRVFAELERRAQRLPRNPAAGA